MTDAVSSRALFTRFPQAVFILLLLAAIGLQWWAAWPLPVIAHRLWAGLAVISLGVLWIGLAIWTMHRHETSPMPWDPTAHLVTSGPFRLGRNPIYLGDVLVLVGLALMLGNTWMLIAAAVSVPLVSVLVIRHEEAYLAEHFGATWLQYCEKVRRWI